MMNLLCVTLHSIRKLTRTHHAQWKNLQSLSVVTAVFFQMWQDFIIPQPPGDEMRSLFGFVLHSGKKASSNAFGWQISLLIRVSLAFFTFPHPSFLLSFILLLSSQLLTFAFIDVSFSSQQSLLPHLSPALLFPWTWEPFYCAALTLDSYKHKSGYS